MCGAVRPRRLSFYRRKKAGISSWSPSNDPLDMVGPVSIVVCTTGCTLPHQRWALTLQGLSALQQLLALRSLQQSRQLWGLPRLLQQLPGFQPRVPTIPATARLLLLPLPQVLRLAPQFGLAHLAARPTHQSMPQVALALAVALREFQPLPVVRPVATGSSTAASAMSVFGMALLCSGGGAFLLPKTRSINERLRLEIAGRTGFSAC